MAGPTWSRTVIPQTTTGFSFPGPLVSIGATGKVQVRATGQGGRSWEETYPPLSTVNATHREFLVRVREAWRAGTVYSVDHLLYQTKLGGGSGSPTVNGANQTGSSLATTGWTGTNPVLRAGDLIAIAGLNQIRELTADAPNLVSGATTLSIMPPIPAGSSPANGASITYAAPVRLQARILGVDWGRAASDGFLYGLTLTWREDV